MDGRTRHRVRVDTTRHRSAPSSGAEDAAVATAAKVMAAVAELEPEDRDLLFLVAWEGCSSALASAATGIPQGNIRSRLSAVRQELRRRVTDIERAAESIDDRAEDPS